jgi:hypothetical protein
MPYADNSGVKIYWNEQGEGDAVLLIMGLGYTMDMWNRTAPVLSQHYRTISFDNRGVGRSDVPPGPYPIAAMAADAAAVMDSAGVTRAHGWRRFWPFRVGDRRTRTRSLGSVFKCLLHVNKSAATHAIVVQCGTGGAVQIGRRSPNRLGD